MGSTVGILGICAQVSHGMADGISALPIRGARALSGAAHGGVTVRCGGREVQAQHFHHAPGALPCDAVVSPAAVAPISYYF